MTKSTKSMEQARWHRDHSSLAFIGLRYVPIFALLNFAWEWAHVPLYTIWREAGLAYIFFSVAHCTLGDVVIGAVSLAATLTLGRERGLDTWRFRSITVLTTIIGTSYTVFSEWRNVKVLRSWSYSDSMPTLGWSGFEIGVTPLLQWILLPPLALYLARWAARIAATRARP